MANNYYQCTPVQALKVTRKEAVELIDLLNPEEEDTFHGFIGEHYEKENTFYMYCEEGGDPDELPKPFLKKLGKLIAKNKLKYLEFGYCFYCDKMRPGEFGGGEFRISIKGEIIYPKINW